ncbi:MAG TPA: hypothetical protein VFU88_16630 [Ktedonobacterales bacterium]|jgi:hypothetical protein|nr:hypothetical protein [Ktedonobacterales bacterium]
MQHLVQWFFTNPQDATGNPDHPEVFHFYLQWGIFCAAILVVWFYYWVEGRKRFFSSHAIHRNILDRMTNQLVVLALVGPIIMFFRYAADASLLADRFWRYLWLGWLAALVIYWAVYFVRTYPDQIKQYRAYRTNQRYVNQPKSKRPKSVAGAR